jgi:hypothetical protein
LTLFSFLSFKSLLKKLKDNSDTSLPKLNPWQTISNIYGL